MEVSHLPAGSHLVGRGALEKEFFREFKSILRLSNYHKTKKSRKRNSYIFLIQVSGRWKASFI